MAITADRGGKSSNSWYQRNIPVNVETKDQDIELWIELDSKGGGVTDIRIVIEQIDYEEIISAMLKCDFDRTVRSFATACQKWRRTTKGEKLSSVSV